MLDLIPAPLGLLLVFAHYAGFDGGVYLILAFLALVAGVITSVIHADRIAHHLGDPMGSLVLAIAVTILEVGLIVSLMLAGGPSTAALARDTVFSAIMIILNGIVGLCLFLGSYRHVEQSFRIDGVSASLATLSAIAILTLVFPNFTTTVPGPFYSSSQLGFIALVSLVLYAAFLLIQSGRHKAYFLDENHHEAPEHTRPLWVSFVFLFLGLAGVVLLAKTLTPAIETMVIELHAPQALVGVLIALIILIPEGIAAVKAAMANRLQTSLNLALGSALASIGLTIPVVAVVSLMTHWPLQLGLDTKSSVLLIFSLFVASFSLNTGKTTVLHGLVHLVIFAVYLFTTIIP
jgi:Ca2+:H+ antiporter